MRDNMNNLDPQGSTVTNETDNTATVSGIIDTQGFNALTFLILTGIILDYNATFTVLVEEDINSNMTAASAVADADLIGTEVLAGFTFALNNGARKIGYVGSKRYVRMTVTPAGNTSNAPIAVCGLLGDPEQGPTLNPPA